MRPEDIEPPAYLARRRAGVVLHLTSLPGAGPTGDLGPAAYRFVDFLVETGFSIWQTLPVGPTQADGSPYQCTSMHAGNPRLISLEWLRDRGWLDEHPIPDGGYDDAWKKQALEGAWQAFKNRADDGIRQAMDRFIGESSHWLEDFALFRALRDEQNACWWDWPESLRTREPQALAEARARLTRRMDLVKFEQFLFFYQWGELKRHANERGILLFGDMPIFVALDSAEVWANPCDFDLNEDSSPRVVAGVPPDYFSATGQRWGNPLYRWDRLRETGFAFWVARMRTQLQLFDLVRIDHFRGFEAYWEIPAEEPHAIHGRWIEAPGAALFQRLFEVFGELPLVAEDLGIITDAVNRLRKQFRLPGMKVLQFAFSGDVDNPYLPYNHSRDSVVYTGTHDNDTTLGWYESLDEHTRNRVRDYLGLPEEPMPWPLIRCALASRSRLAMMPMQDLLALNGAHRMNLPGTAEGNWQWRFHWEQVAPDLARRLNWLCRLYGRV